MKYIKYFEQKALYDEYVTGNPALPNVSYVEDEDTVYYLINKGLPNNVIRYTSSKKETIHDFDILTHEFNDGVGIITFKEDLTVAPELFNWGTSYPKVTSIELPNSITTILSFGFAHLSYLESINIPSSLTTIEDYAFQLSERLRLEEDALINITYIGKWAFYGTTIDTINLPNINYVDELALHGVNTTSITIGENCNFVGFCAFSETGLDTINFNGTMEQWLLMKKSPNWHMRYDGSSYPTEQQIFTVKCSDGDINVSWTYDEGYDEGYNEGYDEGYYDEGY